MSQPPAELCVSLFPEVGGPVGRLGLAGAPNGPRPNPRAMVCPALCSRSWVRPREVSLKGLASGC